MEDKEEFPEDRNQARENLMRLGFLNAEAILNTAALAYFVSDMGEPVLECIDPSPDVDRIEYIFYLGRDKSDAGWYLKGIQAYVELPCSTNIEAGYNIVGCIYEIGNGPLPTKTQIKQEVGAMLHDVGERSAI